MSPRTYLYVPGARPDRFDKAVATGAEAVVLDLEDAVALADKDTARAAVAAWLAGRRPGATQLWVRINPGALAEADIRAVAGAPALTGVLLPKAERREEVQEVDRLLAARGSAAAVQPLLESARAILNAGELANGPRVRCLQLGEVDLCADLGVTPGEDERELLWARSTVVAAAAAAGLDPPVAPVTPDFRDLERFRTTSQALRRLGFWGRACIHPAQVPVAAEAFTIEPEELAWADDVLTRLEHAGGRVATDAAGRLIDEAVARIARRLLARGPAPEAGRAGRQARASPAA